VLLLVLPVSLVFLFLSCVAGDDGAASAGGDVVDGVGGVVGVDGANVDGGDEVDGVAVCVGAVCVAVCVAVLMACWC